MHPDRIYRHFCMMARALEVIGERWSLLLVRDLLLGPRRFTDLARTLSRVTPTRLTDRLQHLEAAGIVVREKPGGGREVWYQLTAAGLDLGPAIEALALWGLEHARQPPVPGESVHGAPAMLETKVWLNTYGARSSNRVAWVWRLGDDDHYALRLADDGWELARGPVEVAAVTVVTTAEAWARCLTTPREHRRLPLADIQLEASRAEAKTFAKAFAAELGSI